MSQRNEITAGYSTEKSTCWALPGLWVDLFIPDLSPDDYRPALKTEDYWLMVFPLEDELNDIAHEDNKKNHYQKNNSETHAFWYPPCPEHCVWNLSEHRESSFLLIGFASPEIFGRGCLKRDMDEIRRNEDKYITIPVTHRMRRIAADILSHLERLENVFSISSDALDLLRHAALSREPASISKAKREKMAIETVCRFLESRLDDPPSMEDLAGRAGMSLTHFKQAFSSIQGCPPFIWLRERRLERAMCLLQRDGLRVTEVALEVGYNNLSHFTKIFENRFGLPPSKVRHKNG